ncbi:MAG: hypothetical protein JO152_13705 [Mycobacteriaceae bacterium]|nr:hypothetical protein [Mycobacteriaceae bacterium]
MGTALLVAPIAAAGPQCTATTPTTTQCEHGGNTQIVTGPSTYSQTGPFLEYPWGTGGIGVGILGKGGI